MTSQAKLYFLCGKMAAGKSTLANALTARENAVLLVQDELLESLYPGEIRTIPDFLDRSARLQRALTAHIVALLAQNISVVLDFPANTTRQREWFRQIIDQTGVDHELHYVDASNALCIAQLKERTKHLPPGTPWTTQAELEAITVYFQPPAAEENFHIVHHHRG